MLYKHTSRPPVWYEPDGSQYKLNQARYGTCKAVMRHKNLTIAVAEMTQKEMKWRHMDIRQETSSDLYIYKSKWKCIAVDV